MQLVPRRCALALAAVIDIAVNARARPVAAKALAARHRLPPRHLETLLQSLVHAHVLRGVRGPHGGYELAGEPGAISAGAIVRAALTVAGAHEEGGGARSALIDDFVAPLLEDAGAALLTRLDAMTVEGLCRDFGKRRMDPATDGAEGAQA